MEPSGSISTSPKDGGRIPVLEIICSGDSLPLVVERFNIKSFSALTILDWLLGLFSSSLFILLSVCFSFEIHRKYPEFA
jgi:hypothetical protein